MQTLLFTFENKLILIILVETAQYKTNFSSTSSFYFHLHQPVQTSPLDKTAHSANAVMLKKFVTSYMARASQIVMPGGQVSVVKQVKQIVDPTINQLISIACTFILKQNIYHCAQYRLLFFYSVYII